MENYTQFLLATSMLVVFTFAACERKPMSEEQMPSVNLNPQPAEPVAKTKTFETSRLAEAINTYEKSPTPENHSSVKSAFSKLDGEIAELKDRAVKTDGFDRAEAAAKQSNLQNYRDSEMIRFMKAQEAAALGVNPPADSRSAAQKVESTAEKVGDKIVEGAKKVGNTVEKAAKNTGDAIKDATH